MPSSQTRTAFVMAQVRSQIAARTYLPGTRLPSVRQQARLCNVSVSTVVEAYERLAADNLIVARPGAGFFVCGPVAPLDLTQHFSAKEREVDPLWISRQALTADPQLLKPGCGWLPSSWMYEDGVRKALRKATRAESSLLTDYASPYGHEDLRQFLQRRLAKTGVSAATDQIMLTESGTQAIDLLCRFLLQPGDCVLVDDPCYFNFHALLRAHPVKIIGVPYTPNGPDLVAFAQLIQTYSPRIYITNSGIHNPTGVSLTPFMTHQLLKIAEAAELVIIEDDIFADFETNPAPRIAAYDGLRNVIQIGSFSKTISASVRCGYIAARREWTDGLVDLKIATSFGGGQLAAMLLLNVLTGSGYRRHMESVRLRLAVAMQATLEKLAPLDILPWHKPQAGMFLWCQLPTGIDAAALSRACLKENIVLAPGNAFSESGTASAFLRFNVSQCNDERIFSVLERALKEPASLEL
ncbi:PLP-dependent aminotransferase family protein [Kalamiella sp. sgz302252]|uniref:aminotransferase-like domain-containing protein n=1 Tax=Pantoea sp. sgz302252 TaxID=3341827 RepID=UPI0036D33816